MKHETRIYTGVQADLLPRYQFTETGVGCSGHADPNCLCDVVVTCPVDVDATEIRFGDLASQVCDGLSPGTFYEFAELLLGMHEAHASLPPDLGLADTVTASDPRSVLGNGHKRKGTAWSALPDEVRDQIRACWTKKTPWREASKFLPETVVGDDYKSIAKYYNERLYAKPKTTTTRKDNQ